MFLSLSMCKNRTHLFYIQNDNVSHLFLCLNTNICTNLYLDTQKFIFCYLDRIPALNICARQRCDVKPCARTHKHTLSNNIMYAHIVCILHCSLVVMMKKKVRVRHSIIQNGCFFFSIPVHISDVGSLFGGVRVTCPR